jgi:hypothetical protein
MSKLSTRARVTLLTMTCFIAMLVSAAVAQQNRAAIRPAAAPVAVTDGSYPGEIRAFAGEACPSNWLPADGRELQVAAHASLNAAIGDLWGSTNVSSFQLPDLRGEFLRGWNHNRDNGDPSSRERIIPPGAPIDASRGSDQVGTSQRDQFLRHQHTTDLTARWGDKYADTIGFSADNGEHPHGGFSLPTTPTGGAETRPRNVYVLYCIRDGR